MSIFFRLITIITIVSSASSVLAQQNKIEGVVYEWVNKVKSPLPGANVYWMNGQLGTTTDANGYYSIERSNQNKLIASFVGLKADTIQVNITDTKLDFLLESSDNVLSDVNLVQREKATKVDLFGAAKVETIGSKELKKAACCNLSESFETNPSIDVAIADAVTGTKQIRMLGLAGPYAQITRENMPYVRGLSAVSGLTYTPGHWIKDIQINKGAGSVVNGFESITGQINVCLEAPSTMDRMYLNFYSNAGGRMEANANLKADIGENIGTALLLHASGMVKENDRNADGFLDMPTGKNLLAVNRWELFHEDIHAQVGIKGVLVDKQGGQLSTLENPSWTSSNEVKRFESWAKIGFVRSEDKPWNSTGLQISTSYHDQKSFYGLKSYDATQKSFYANLVNQGIINNTNHTVKYGVSYQYDATDETLDFGGTIGIAYKESVPGAFVEYAYKYGESFDLVLGGRVDKHSIYGMLYTPRIHTRIALSEKSVLRFSGGRGAKTARVFAENIGLFANNRNLMLPNVIFPDQLSIKPYNLDQETAWNFGGNYTYKFKLDYRDAVLALDVYHTRFVNKAIIDYYQNATEVWIYQSSNAFATSVQAQFDYELLNRLDVRLAYRFLNAQSEYQGVLIQDPLQARHRAFINIAYETLNYYKFDLTVNSIGKKKLPNTAASPEQYQLESSSPRYTLINAQVSKSWEKQGLEIYVGGENLLDFRQDNPIVSVDDPSSQYFDASMIWGPVFGRNIYAGLRYKLK